MKKLLIIFLLIIIASSLSANISVKLDRLYCLQAGEFVELQVLLENQYPSYQLGGYDFLIEYDSRLIFTQANPGDLLNNCGWEYFTYSSPSPNSIRLVALAETNNGSNHPSCFADVSGSLASISFQIATDASNIDDFLPVWWSWSDCGDNSISSSDGNDLYISDSVFYFNGSTDLYITQESLFPTPYGSPNECVADSVISPTRMINFLSGGFDISQAGFQVHCPSDIIAPNDNGACGAIINFDIPLNSECVGITAISSPPSGSYFPIGTTTVTTVATDDIGHIDSCNFTVTIQDTESPTITIPSDTILYTTLGEWWAKLDYQFSATDICSGVTLSSSHPSGSYFSIGSTDVSCIATDSSGNTDTSIFVVTVIDNESPILQCPDTIVLPTEIASCGAVAEFSINATDNSNMVTIATSIESGSYFPAGTTIVIATAEDPYGNSDSCSFVVIVEDKEAPQINCIQDIIVSNDIGQCGAIVDFNLTATDNCGDPTITYSETANSFFPIGSTLVVATATDESQNSSTCQFYVIVQGTEPPQISAPNNMILSNNFDNCGAIVDYTYTASDNCDGYVVTTTLATGSFVEVGSTLVVLQITDNAGLQNSDSFMVMIEDSQPPLIENVFDLEIISDSGFYGAIADYEPQISDNCLLNTTSITPPSGTYFEIGEHEISVKATDLYGNSDSTIFTVSVNLQDSDNDLIADYEDNCSASYNPDQEDTNLDGIGDACCCIGIRGNSNGGFENPPSNNSIDISDLIFTITYMFGNPRGTAPSCPSEADINGSGKLDISDLIYLVDFMFGNSGIPPQDCP